MNGLTRRDSESLIDIDRQNKRLRHELWTERVRWGLPPTLVLRCSHNGRWYVAGAGQTHGLKIRPLVCRKQMPILTIPPGWQHIYYFQVWEKSSGRRWQALAPYTMDPRDIFEAVTCLRSPCPTPSGLTVDWDHVEIEGLASHELIFLWACCQFTTKKTNSPVNNVNRSNIHFYFPA